MLKSIIDGYKISQPLLYSCDHKISVWLFSHKNKQSKIRCLFDILSQEEKKRADKINHSARKRAYISGHALLRYLLSSLNETEISPEIWDIRYNIYGKPSPIPVPGLPEYTCSLSYTNDIVAIAIAEKHAIGVDIELIPLMPPEQIPWQVLTRKESERVRQKRNCEQYEAFLKIWTIKEAFAKAVGRGVSFDFQRIEVGFDPVRVLFKDPGGVSDTQVSVQHIDRAVSQRRFSLGLAAIKETTS